MRNLLGTKRGHLLAQLEVGLAELLGKRSPHSCLRVEDQANTTTTNPCRRGMLGLLDLVSCLKVEDQANTTITFLRSQLIRGLLTCTKVFFFKTFNLVEFVLYDFVRMGLQLLLNSNCNFFSYGFFRENCCWVGFRLLIQVYSM